jgi:hypothetical protein
VYEAEQALMGAKQAGVPVRYLLFEDEGHEIQRTENRIRFIHEVTDWLCEHFGLAEPAVPADVPPADASPADATPADLGNERAARSLT